jgi:GNAT superfamily N-acetyltransferase
VNEPGMLTDGNLRLRPANLPDDVEVGWPWYQDPATLDLSERPGTEPMSRDRVEHMYRYLFEHGEFYIIEVREPPDGPDGAWMPIGDVMLAPNTLPIVIGDPGRRRRGIGRRVLALLIARARALGWTELHAKQIWSHNQGSLALFRSMGFVRESTGVDEAGLSFERYRLKLDPERPASGEAKADRQPQAHSPASEGLPPR